MVTLMWIGLALVGLVLISYLVERLRPSPPPPERLAWAPTIPIQYVEVNGSRLRYISTGNGPPLVLLHTLRTQLDMFQRVVPALSQRFRVYALDYPGHGYSEIPRGDYSADFFVTAVERFLERLDISHAVVLGESIGGTIALLLAARHNPRVKAVVAVNPYDYDRGRGLERSSLLGKPILRLNDVPVLGGTFQRLRSYPLVRQVFQGGVVREGAFPPTLPREMYRVGNRRGHNSAFMALIHQWPSWERARQEYSNIDQPVLLIYGERDWSREDERQANRRALPRAASRVVPNAGHFLALDAPEELLKEVFEFTGGLARVG
ncbi:MAG TPA: alpha/beta hydrolase [Gemmatimonadales bacterium]|jgi:pimeloyl-ACP methyl ester carboxylesterase